MNFLRLDTNRQPTFMLGAHSGLSENYLIKKVS